MKCPKCGSNKYHYVLRSASSNSYYYRHPVKKSYFFSSGRRNTTHRQKSVGFCPDCGYRDDPEDNPLAGFIVLVIIILIIVFAFKGCGGSNTRRQSKSEKTTIEVNTEKYSD